MTIYVLYEDSYSVHAIVTYMQLVHACCCSWPVRNIYITEYDIQGYRAVFGGGGGGGAGGGGGQEGGGAVAPLTWRGNFFSPLIMLRTQQLQLAIMDLPIHFVK